MCSDYQLGHNGKISDMMQTIWGIAIFASVELKIIYFYFIVLIIFILPQNWGNHDDLVILWNQAYPHKVFWLRSACGNGWVYIINQQGQNMNWVLQKTFRFLVFGDLKISVTFSFALKISSLVLIVVDCKCQYWRTINNNILRCWGFDLYLI